MSKRLSSLGKGLDALIAANVGDDGDQVAEVPVGEIRPNPYQPRKEFDPAALDELANSIREYGIVQPLIVRKSIKGYELIAGERRLRASKEAGLSKVPVVVKTYNDQQVMEIALIENLQRENLNPIEEAEAYQKLIENCSYTKEELGKKIGKSRPHVANMLRLLQLPDNIRGLVSAGQLSMGHARALITLEDTQLQWQLANEVVKDELSVRQLEEWVKQVQQPDVSRETKKKQEVKKERAILHIEERIQNRFGTGVQIHMRANKKGKIEIEFYSQDDLERIIELLNVEE